MTFEEYLTNYTKHTKLGRGVLLYTCKLCYCETLTPRDHFEWVHGGEDK